MARLYANENFPFPVVDALRRFGHDVLTTQDAGRSGQAIPDRAVLEFALAGQRAVVTLNRRDFVALHKLNNKHAGIIVCTVDSNHEDQATRIHEAISRLQDLSGQLIRVNRPLV